MLFSLNSKMQKRVWITGAGGLIGGQLVEKAPSVAGQVTVRGLTRADLELTDYAAVQRAFREEKPDCMIHCAALTRSPVCQENPGLAWKINVEVTKVLAELGPDIPLIFFSTDLVFDGKKGNYIETDTPNPLSVYAETKVAAEEVVLGNPLHAVVRTSLNYGKSASGNRAFNEEMLLAWQQGRVSRLFTDEFRCPIAASVVAEVVWKLVQNYRPGVYHLAGGERLSRWQIGQLVADKHGVSPNLMAPVPLSEYKGAPRPPDTSLDCAKIERALGVRLPKFSEWLRQCPG